MQDIILWLKILLLFYDFMSVIKLLFYLNINANQKYAEVWLPLSE